MKALLEQLPDDARLAVRTAFEMMEVAEEEILRAIIRCPAKENELKFSFGILEPGPLVRYGVALYRAHARELLERVASGEKVDGGTAAECLAALSEGSLKAPLASSYAHAMTWLFRKCFPTAKVEDAGSEGYPGELGEILAELRRKTSRQRP